jgi:putative alpha-1,2-mannosidase
VIPKKYSAYFCESNAWQYFWSVPQNVEGLIKTVGRDAFDVRYYVQFRSVARG